MFIVCLIIQGNSSQKSRQNESGGLIPYLSDLKMTQLRGCVDGGDVLFCFDRVLIGISNRTDELGANSLKMNLLMVDDSLTIDFVKFEGELSDIFNFHILILFCFSHLISVILS
jgi:N-dimethylarginine dimethylaminohydrolase